MTKIRSCMKRFKFQITSMSNFKDFIGKFFNSLLSFFSSMDCICTSRFKHDLKLSSFYHGMRDQKITEVHDTNDGTVPSPYGFADNVGFFIGRNGSNNSSNSFFHPFKKYYFSIRDCYVSLINTTLAIFIPSNRFRDVNGSFSIHDTGKISNLMLREISSVKVCHRTPILHVCEGL